MNNTAFNKLSREQELIRNIIYKTGYLNLDQIKSILKGVPDKGLDIILNVLCVKQYIDRTGDVFYPHGITDHISRINTDGIWAFINEISNREDYKTVEKAEFPSNYGFIVDSKVMYEIAVITSDNMINLLQLQNRFYAQYGRGEVTFFKYIFVIEDENMLDKIAEYDLKIPHKIVLLEYDSAEKRPIFKTFE